MLVLTADPAIEGWFRWILKYGPSYRIWSICTLETGAVTEMGDWLDLFRTHILAHTSIPLRGYCESCNAPSMQTLGDGDEYVLCGGGIPLPFRSLSPG